MSTGFTIYACLFIAAAVAYALTLMDEYRLDGRGGNGGRHEAGRHGRTTKPRGDGSARGDFHERLN